MKIYHSVSIDLTREDACVHIPALSGTEGDRGTHVLKIQLLQDGEAWPIPDDATAVISYARLDGTGGTYDTLPSGESAWSIKDGLVYVELAPACFAVPTKPWEEIWLTVTLLQGDKQLTTQRIPFVVRRSLVVNGEEGGIYVSFASVISQYIGDITQLNTENTESIVGAINEALDKCENSVVSVQSLRVSENHELLVTLTNGKILNAGRVLVPGSIGGVSTVCGIAPDEDGDVPVTAEDVGALPRAEAASSAWVKEHLANRNFIDNWYFKNMVNQRGQYGYSTAGAMYDRWVLSDNVQAYADEYGLLLCCDGVYVCAGQYVDEPQTLDGHTVTISALLTENSGDFLMSLYLLRGSSETILQQATTDAAGLVSMTCQLPKGTVLSGDRLFLRIGNNQTTLATFKLSAVKMELGDTQTLAYEEDGVWKLYEIADPVAQLYRCQRYFQVFRSQSLRPTHAVDFRPPMRATPTLATMSINGVTHYIASAD